MYVYVYTYAYLSVLSYYVAVRCSAVQMRWGQERTPERGRKRVKNAYRVAKMQRMYDDVSF